MQFHQKLAFGLAAAFGLFALPMAFAQTITTGDVVGTVKDTTGAVVPGATVTLKSNDFGDARAVNTDGAGAFRFTFLKPGNYTVGALRRRVENRSPKAGGRSWRSGQSGADRQNAGHPASD